MSKNLQDEPQRRILSLDSSSKAAIFHFPGLDRSNDQNTILQDFTFIL